MAKVESEKLIAHLSSKWGGRACPMCGGGPWNVHDTVFQLMEFHGGNIAIGGPVIPVVPVVCGNCGHTVLVNAITSGVIQAPPSPTGEGSK